MNFSPLEKLPKNQAEITLDKLGKFIKKFGSWVESEVAVFSYFHSSFPSIHSRGG